MDLRKWCKCEQVRTCGKTVPVFVMHHRTRDWSQARCMQSTSLPWERLIEGSDAIGRFVVKIAAYKDTAQRRDLRGGHCKSRGQAEFPYSFRPRRDAKYPFGVFVVRKLVRRANETIACLGLGNDVSD